MVYKCRLYVRLKISSQKEGGIGNVPDNKYL